MFAAIPDWVILRPSIVDQAAAPVHLAARLSTDRGVDRSARCWLPALPFSSQEQQQIEVPLHRLDGIPGRRLSRSEPLNDLLLQLVELGSDLAIHWRCSTLDATAMPQQVYDG